MGKTLLLADDSVTIQKVVGISFASEDIAITTVDNGDDAITKARELKPDVILADVVMPGKSGYEVCETVKADPGLRHIPVLLLTGTFEAFDEERAGNAGAAGHVAKPFEAQTLVERVKDLLAQSASGTPVSAPSPAPTPTATPAPPAAQPLTASGGADNAFDFFDDPGASATAARPAAPPPVPAAPPVPQAPERAELEVDGPDAAFVFGADELSSHDSTTVIAENPAAAAPPPPAAHTVAILPDVTMPDASGPAAPQAAAPATPEPTPPRPPSMPPVPAPAASPAPAARQGLDEFEFEGMGPGPNAGISESTLLDPAGDSAFDVSSSDLASLVAGARKPAAPAPGGPGPAETQLLDTPFPGAEAALGGEPSPPSQLPPTQDPVMDMLAPDPVTSGPPAPSAPFVEELPTAAPSRMSDPMGYERSDGLLETPRSTTWPEEGAGESTPGVAEPESLEASPLPAEPETLETPMPEPPIAEPGPALDAGPHSDDALAQIAPALQEQLHETLEKIAWEAFGNVTEKVVEQAVERLEKIAWEVVPKLAETLIQEEIRKLKR